MAQISGTQGPAASGQPNRQNNQNLIQERIRRNIEPGQIQGTAQNNTTQNNQAANQPGQANQPPSPGQNTGGNVNIVI